MSVLVAIALAFVCTLFGFAAGVRLTARRYQLALRDVGHHEIDLTNGGSK